MINARHANRTAFIGHSTVNCFRLAPMLPKVNILHTI